MLALMIIAAAFQAKGTSPPPPPPPPVIYDPQPGPFIVRLDDAGRLDENQYRVIANAVRNWSGSSLQAFSICFHQGVHPIDWRSASNAMDVVTRELKAQQARVIVSPSGASCGSASVSVVPGSYVEIIGVVQC